ncbi:transcriptional antiterminator NusG [Agrobacterium vitis]|nr:transcriptional antiterminator NusG [Agrobacterium vitis]
MMQHKDVSGVAIGGPVSCDDFERMIRLDTLRLGHRDCGLKRRWFAVAVASGREKAVENDLQALGVEALVPLRKIPKRKRGPRVFPEQWVPVIHGYILVCLPAQVDILAGLLGVKGVRGLVGGFEFPRPLLTEEVNNFKRLAKAGAYDADVVCGFTLARDEKVRVKAGPFAGMMAVTVTPSTRGKGEVVVLIDLLGAMVPVTLPLALVEKL